MTVILYNRFLHRLNNNIINNIIKSMGVAVVQWAGHGSFKREVLCSIPDGLWWCQEGHPTSNAPVPH